MIKPGMDSRQVMARFAAERQALALMDHANIARVLEGGVSAEGRPYFVMELVKGIPITRYCDEHQLTPRQRLALFVPICQAIQHAHQKGIIHRDLKPSNVLVAAYDGQPMPKVIDFGVAKALGQSLTDRTLVTGFGGIIGTLEYMSPEQAEFNALDVDTRTDIYSLGVLLYELFTGTTPLTKDRIGRAAIAESLRLIREEDPPSPSSRLTDSKDTLASVCAQRKMEPARLTKEMRGELDWIVMKCLEKDRNRRYATANGLIRDIERFMNDEPVEAGPPSSGYKFRKFLRRNRGPVLAAALVLLALLGGILGTSMGLVRAEGERRRANEASEQALRNLASSRQNLDLAVRAVDQFFTQVSTDPRLKEHDLRPLRQSLLKSAVEFHQKLLESRAQHELAHHDLALSHKRLAALTAEIEAPNHAIRYYRRAIEEFEQVLKSRPSDVDAQCDLAESLASIGHLFLLTNNSSRADDAFRQSIDLLKSVLKRHPQRSGARQQLAASLGNQAFALSMTRRHEEAKVAWRQAIEQWTRLTKEHPDNVMFASHLAHSHMKLGTVTLTESITHWPDAAAECEIALAIQRKAASHSNASEFERRVLSLVLAEFARIRMISGNADEAIPMLQESQKLLERLRKEQPPSLVMPTN
jgi:serine/threonine protein kinase